MKLLIALLLSIFLVLCNEKSTQKFNFDFEKLSTDQQFFEGWSKSGDSKIGIEKMSKSGKYAPSIENNDTKSVGSLVYKIPNYYLGKEIKLEGSMKTENVEKGYAAFQLRTYGHDSPHAIKSLQSIMADGSTDWKKYDINLPLPEEATTIEVTCIFIGKGKAWFDDIVLTIDGEDIQTLKEVSKLIPKASRDREFDTGSNIEFPELTEELIANLELLGRVWGFLKYHHPEICNGNYNWDYELFRMLPEYLSVKNQEERDLKLLKWIGKYGKIAECESCHLTHNDAVLKPDLSWIGSSDINNIDLKKKLNEIYENRHQGRQSYFDKLRGICNMVFLNEDPYSNMPFPDEGFRLLALYRYWNIIHYFFPYKHLTDKDWNETLKEYISRFIDAQDELEYGLAMLEIIGDINDSHAQLRSKRIDEEKGKFYPPVRVQFIDDKLVVTDNNNEKNGLTPGDILTHINEKPVEDIVDSLKRYYPASNHGARMRDMARDILRSKNDQINIRYISDGMKRQKDIILSDTFYNYRGNATDQKSFSLLDDSIGYVVLGSLKDEDFPLIKKFMKNTKGMIIDIRNYPTATGTFSLTSYFVSKPTPFVKFTIGNVKNPGEFHFTERILLTESSYTYPGKLVVIVNELSQSAAEYHAMAFRAGENTTVVGSPTAGADGNVSPIHLPGGLITRISGIGVYYPDGTETQRVGIIPDIEVKPTIEGIKKGKDELLEKAIELINNQDSGTVRSK